MLWTFFAFDILASIWCVPLMMTVNAPLCFDIIWKIVAFNRDTEPDDSVECRFKLCWYINKRTSEHFEIFLLLQLSVCYYFIKHSMEILCHFRYEWAYLWVLNKKWNLIIIIKRMQDFPNKIPSKHMEWT